MMRDAHDELRGQDQARAALLSSAASKIADVMAKELLTSITPEERVAIINQAIAEMRINIMTKVAEIVAAKIMEEKRGYGGDLMDFDKESIIEYAKAEIEKKFRTGMDVNLVWNSRGY